MHYCFHKTQPVILLDHKSIESLKCISVEIRLSFLHHICVHIDAILAFQVWIAHLA